MVLLVCLPEVGMEVKLVVLLFQFSSLIREKKFLIQLAVIPPYLRICVVLVQLLVVEILLIILETKAHQVSLMVYLLELILMMIQ